jgi:DNA polymerase-3 subunit alpha
MSYFSMHNHTYYSYLDGYASPKEYFESCKRNGLSGFCITDHGNNCAWVYFDELKKQYPEIKMCYGCEMYECEDINIKDSHSKYWHLLVIARTEEGRKALDWLITESQKGFYYKPRVDLDTFRECFKHFSSDSLIISSACLQSKLSRTEDYNKCLDYVKEYKEIFPHFYLEMQSHRFQDQAEYNKKILKLSQDTDTPFVITTDSHYANESDEYFQNLWTQVGKKTVSGVDELRVSECYEGCFIQNEAQIHYTMDGQVGYDNVCKGLEETNLILNMIDKIDMPWQQPALPDYPLPEGYTSLHDYMTALINKGFVERGIMQKPKEELNIYIQRARYEMSVIEKMGFDGYFLIVREAVDWCKKNGIGVGAGRGSGCGSLVNYCIKITEIDPVKYKLVFERFLNPERVGMPKQYWA